MGLEHERMAFLASILTPAGEGEPAYVGAWPLTALHSHVRVFEGVTDPETRLTLALATLKNVYETLRAAETLTRRELTAASGFVEIVERLCPRDDGAPAFERVLYRILQIFIGKCTMRLSVLEEGSA